MIQGNLSVLKFGIRFTGWVMVGWSFAGGGLCEGCKVPKIAGRICPLSCSSCCRWSLMLVWMSRTILALGSVWKRAFSNFESLTDGMFLNSVWVSSRGRGLDRCSEVSYLVIDSVKMVTLISWNTTKCC
jgi:hypothetical protein